MSASAGIAASSAAIAVQAAAAAREAKVIACKSSVKGYQHDGATVTEMVCYADCLRILAPAEPMTSGETIVLKICIALVLGGLLVCGTWGKSALGDSLVDVCMGAFLGAVGVAGALFVLVLMYMGIAFLFS